MKKIKPIKITITLRYIVILSRTGYSTLFQDSATSSLRWTLINIRLTLIATKHTLVWTAFKVINDSDYYLIMF